MQIAGKLPLQSSAYAYGLWLALLVAVCASGAVRDVRAQELLPGVFYYYVPEHEKYSRTEFYSQPTFSSAQVRVPRTQRFKLVGGSKGWGMVEFETAGKAFIHLRLLRMLVYDPAASDPWYEFGRASVFAEDPKKIEARMRGPRTPDAQVTDSKVPAWKRYKDSWGINKGRAPQGMSESGDAQSSFGAPRPIEKKARNRHPLLPPIGSEPRPEDGDRQSEVPGEPVADQRR